MIEERVKVWVPLSMWERLKQQAHKNQHSAAAELRVAIVRHLETPTPTLPMTYRDAGKE